MYLFYCPIDGCVTVTKTASLDFNREADWPQKDNSECYQENEKIGAIAKGSTSSYFVILMNSGGDSLYILMFASL